MGGKNIFKSAFKSVYIPVKKTARWFRQLKKPMKYFTVGLCAFILFDLYLLWHFFMYGSTSPVKLEFTADRTATELFALDSPAHKGLIKQADYASFKFSGEQLEKIMQSFDACGSAALAVRVKFLPTSKQKKLFENAVDLPLQFGFLEASDFTEKGKFIHQSFGSGNRLIVQGNMKNASEILDISIALNKDDFLSGRFPKGFFYPANPHCSGLCDGRNAGL